MKHFQPSKLLDLFSAALDLLLPPRCTACAAVVASAETPFCELCWQSVLLVDRACPRCGLPGQQVLCPHCARVPPPFSTARAAVEYGGQAAVAIRQLKYGGRSYLARPLATLLGPTLAGLRPPDVVLPVPLHRRRLRHRGYNQAAELTNALVRGKGLRVSFNALRRDRDGGSQASLGRHQRLENLRGAFTASGQRVGGARVLLVDDVMTTGATATACAEALLEAGAREVEVLTLARSARENLQGTQEPMNSWVP